MNSPGSKPQSGSSVWCSAWLGGIVGIAVGLVLGSLLVVFVLKPLFPGKKPPNKHAQHGADNANPSCPILTLNLLNNEPHLPFMLGTNKLRGILGNFSLKDGELFVGQLSKNSGVHLLKTNPEPLKLILVPVVFLDSGSQLLITPVFIHSGSALPPNDEAKEREPKR